MPVLEQMAADALTGKIADVDIVLLNPAPGGLDVDYLGTRASDGQSIYRAPCEKKYATVGHLDAEQHILSQADKPRLRLVHPERAEAAVAAAGQLSGDQTAALQALLTSDTARRVPDEAVDRGLSRPLADNTAGIATGLDAGGPSLGGDLTLKRSDPGVARARS